jgi:hypothetical protein
MTTAITETPEQCAKRIKQYLDWGNREFQTKLKTAETIGDKRDIFVAYTKPEYNLINLFTSPSPYVVDVINILDGMVEGTVEPKRPVPQAPAKQAPKLTVAVHDPKSGELLYRKSQPRKFTYKEMLFIRQSDRRGVKPAELMEQFNQQFDVRTKSSVATKMYRLRSVRRITELK